MHGLTPLANRLESFCITDLDNYWVPKELLEYIGDEMNLLKHLKVSVCTMEDDLEESTRCLKAPYKASSVRDFVSYATDVHGCPQACPTFVSKTYGFTPV